MKKIITAAVALITALPLLLTGCFDEPLSDEQKEWFSILQENYPDDTFVCKGHGIAQLGSIDYDSIRVTSELFEGRQFGVWMIDGQLVSDYTRVYHEEAVESYYGGIVSEYFDCDDIEIRYMDLKAKPIDYMSHEDYIEEYAFPHFNAILFYDDGRGYPDEDEIVSSIIQYLSTVPQDQHVSITFYFCRTDAGDPYQDNDMKYCVDYSNGTVYEIEDCMEDRVIITDQSLEDLAADYM
ncbi:MAG: hypothetical protein J5685_00350 [Clostridiales bacterium]|nr:hypothetical protein [Clostridiales bacterium]